LPTPHSGFAALRAGLVTDTYLEAMTVEPVKRQYSDYVMTSEIEDKIELLQSGKHRRISQKRKNFTKRKKENQTVALVLWL